MGNTKRTKRAKSDEKCQWSANPSIFSPVFLTGYYAVYIWPREFLVRGPSVSTSKEKA